ncbi:MAG: aldo/keto reductase [Gemmatimonadaceae bacterium]|jgi:predicted oxidoreductase|nr:aldo/keto reductase [Gemmatimonadaceae bacterium]
MVPRHRLAAHGPEFSRLAYGTWRLLNDTTPPTPQSVLARLQRCADLGITTIDTAEIYGRYQVEEALGAALALDKGLRQRLEIVTKAGIYVPNAFHPARKVSYYDATGARLIKSLEKSLRFLGVGHVELLLVHRPDWLTHPDETAEGLNRLLKDGKIRSAGVSNYNVHQFDALNARMDEPLVTNQVEFSLLRMDPIFDGVLDHCMRLGVSPMAWSPLGGGRLVRTDDEAGVRVQQAVAEIAERRGGATVDQVAYAWIMAHPSRPMPIIGSNQVERIERAAKAATIQLTREDWYALWTAAQGKRIP